MKKLTNIIRWIGIATFTLMVIYSLTQGGFLGALLILLGGILIAPLSIIKRLRNKLKFNKAITIILSIVLLFVGIIATPTSTEPVNSQNNSATSSQTVTSNKTSSLNKTNSSSKKESVSTDTTSSTSINAVSSKNNTTSKTETNSKPTVVGNGKYTPVKPNNIPAYSGKAYITVNNNTPNFSSDELKTVGYETYSNLDSLGRTQMAIAVVGKDTMPKSNEERESISNIKPSGWKQAKYDNISGKYLYNRCHLIGWQLSAENANKKNLITGTKHLNVEGMLPFENIVADYIKETGNHVAYRITPIYKGNNLLASGVQMEAYSVEDNGEGICFNVYCYNVQPDITINYADGSSKGPESQTNSTTTSSKPQSSSSNTASKEQTPTVPPVESKKETTSTVVSTPDTSNSNTPNSVSYVLNTSTKKFHIPSCRHVSKIAEENFAETNNTRDFLISDGYDPCGTCKP